MEFNKHDFEKIGPEAGEVVRRIRTDRFKMTQDAFASLLGVSQSTLRSWESGQTGVPSYVLTSVRMMASDPGQALALAEAGVCPDAKLAPAWRTGACGVSAVRREDAVDWMLQDGERADLMDAASGFLEFMDRCSDTGMSRFGSVEMLLLHISRQLDMLLSRLPAQAGE